MRGGHWAPYVIAVESQTGTYQYRQNTCSQLTRFRTL